VLDIDDQARALYEAAAPCAPTWDQLGEITRSVWQERADRKAAGDPHWWSIKPAAPLPAAGGQGDLF
jgi:hypothetical protein